MSNATRKTLHRIPEQRCPFCGTEISATSTAGEEATEAPEPGDPVVCIKCASVNTPDENQQLRQMTRAEIDGFDPITQTDVRRIQEAILFLKAKKAVNN